MTHPNSMPKLVLLALALIPLLCLTAGSASAGTAGVAFVAPNDFDDSGESDVLLQRVVGTNTGLNEVQLVTGTTSTTRGWPDMNRGNSNGREYETLGSGRFDAAAGSAIITRKVSGGNAGLIRIVRLQADGITRAAPGQYFVGGSGTEWAWVGAADMNGDGPDDFVFAKVSGPDVGMIRVVFMDPVTPFKVLQTTHPGSLPSNNTTIGLGDADGDGQADLWTADLTTQVVEVLISDGFNAFARSEMPTAVPTNYVVRGIGFFNRSDSRADLLMEADTGAADPGVLRIDYTGDNGGSGNAPATTFPALLDTALGENTAAVGDYDGINQLDVATRMSSPANAANTGVIVIRLMNGDGTDMAGTPGTLPQIRDLDWNVIDGGTSQGL